MNLIKTHFIFFFLTIKFSHLYSEESSFFKAIPIGANVTGGSAYTSLWANPAILAGKEDFEFSAFGGIDLGLSQQILNYGAVISYSGNSTTGISFGFFSGENMPRYRTLIFQSSTDSTGSFDINSQIIPISLASKLSSWLQIGLSTHLKMSGSTFTLPQSNIGLILGGKKGIKLGLYLPELKSDNALISSLAVGLGYEADTFAITLDYTQLQTQLQKVHFGLSFAALERLLASISWHLPLSTGTAQVNSFLALIQVSTFLKYFLSTSFYSQIQVNSSGLIMGGIGMVF